MQCKIARDVWVQTEVDVDVDDVMAELSDRVQKEGEYPRSMVAVYDFTIRLMERIPDATAKQFNAEHRRIIHERLTKEAARFA